MSRLQECAESRAVLAALAPKIVSCTEPFNSQVIGNALCGLQNRAYLHNSALIRPLEELLH